MIRSWLTDLGFTWGPTLALLLFFGLFIAVLVWVFRPGSRKAYEHEARLPLEDGGPRAAEPSGEKEEHHG